MNRVIPRPLISNFSEPLGYLREMLAYRKEVEPNFSIYRSTQGLRRVSPALISLILSGKRRITRDRADELAKLMNLNGSERSCFKNWLEADERHAGDTASLGSSSRTRKEASLSLLSDWLNVYVKDLFQLPEVQRNPELIYQRLAPVAKPARIQKCFEFLLAQGYLRRTLAGEIVIETRLSVTDPKVPAQKIRNFHRAALRMAQASIELYPPDQRVANTMTLPLTSANYQELTQLLEELSERLMSFAEKAESDQGEQLYQITMNLCPVGGISR